MLLIGLTTTFQRCGRIGDVLRSIDRQRPRPDRILLMVSREPFLHDGGFGEDEDFAELARSLGALNIEGLELWRVPNYGPLRKLLLPLGEARYDDIVVTADDDVLYPAGWLEQLLAADDGENVVCGKARRITPGAPYQQWPRVTSQRVPTGDLVPLGRDGVLYRRRYLSDGVFDVAGYLRLCPAQDDLWIAAHRRRGCGVRVVPAGSGIEPIPAHRPLWHENIRGGGNDAAIERLAEAGLWRLTAKPSRGEDRGARGEK